MKLDRKCVSVEQGLNFVNVFAVDKSLGFCALGLCIFCFVLCCDPAAPFSHTPVTREGKTICRSSPRLRGSENIQRQTALPCFT